ncbi:unnamed protein product [Effrenium voratum]|nr:unnamed protein product [Effrenium voratum]
MACATGLARLAHRLGDRRLATQRFSRSPLPIRAQASLKAMEKTRQAWLAELAKEHSRRCLVKLQSGQRAVTAGQSEEPGLDARRGCSLRDSDVSSELRKA